MHIAYFDCFAGLSGEMALGALLGAGLSIDELRAALSRLPLSGYTIDTQSVVRKELSGTYLTINGPQRYTQHDLSGNGDGHGLTPNGDNGNSANSANSAKNGHGTPGDHDHAPLSATCLISKSDLPDVVKRTSLEVFRRLAQAEAAVFPRWTDMSLSSQETDAVLTVVGVVAGLWLLGIDRVECSPLHVGSGVAQTSHGVKPVLSPITVEILRAAGVPVYGSHIGDVLVTPVGAAIITTLASAFGPVPAMKMGSVGYGAGSYDLPETSNVVRLLIGEATGRSITTYDLSQVETPAEVESISKPFVATQEEWVALTIQGHQQSGRQRLAS
jgi:uncharacterized protein (DUF111 family)